MLGSRGGWIASRALRHACDVTPGVDAQDSYYPDAAQVARLRTNVACVFIGNPSTESVARGVLTTVSGPVLLVDADDPLATGDVIANVRAEDGTTVLLAGPVEVLACEPATTHLRVATLKGTTD